MRHHIADEEFKPQLVTTGFNWLRDDGAPAVTAEGPGVWTNAQLPPGFHLAAQTAQMMPGVAEPVTHLVFSDGIATVSVFIQTADHSAAHPIRCARAWRRWDPHPPSPRCSPGTNSSPWAKCRLRRSASLSNR